LARALSSSLYAAAVARASPLRVTRSTNTKTNNTEQDPLFLSFFLCECYCSQSGIILVHSPGWHVPSAAPFVRRRRRVLRRRVSRERGEPQRPSASSANTGTHQHIGCLAGVESKDQQVTHTHTHRQRTTPPTPTHTHTRQEQHPKPPNIHPPQTFNNARRWRDDGAGVV